MKILTDLTKREERVDKLQALIQAPTSSKLEKRKYKREKSKAMQAYKKKYES